MKKLLLILLILSSSTLWAEKHALLVGVSNVRGGNTLFTDMDIYFMKQMLTKAGFTIHTLTGNNASLEKVRTSFKSFYRLKKKDTFLFYYTGHGARMRGINKNEPVDNFFVLNNAYFSDDNTIGGGILTDNEYSMHLHKISAQKVSIVDACHSASIYKSLSKPKFVKSILPKGANTIFNRANSIRNFQSFKPNNLINISASKDNQQAENSPKGSIFTVALVKLIKNNPNISFATLENKLQKAIPRTARSIAQLIAKRDPKSIYTELEGKFNPKINTAPLRLKKMLIKDIFVKRRQATPSVSAVLNAKPNSNKINISTSNGKNSYALHQSIKFNITSKIRKGYLYLFEKKQNRYTLLGKRVLEECQNRKNEKYCKFSNIFATEPLGKSIAYVVVTKNPIKINNKSIKKDFEITEDFFDVETQESLATQIKNKSVAKGSFVLWVK